MTGIISKVDQTIVNLEGFLTAEELNEQLDMEFNHEFSRLLLVYSKLVGNKRYINTVDKHRIFDNP